MDAQEAVEPAQKKCKVDDIFREVLQNKLKKELELAVICLERGLNELLLREIKVIDANANRAVSFSRASIGMTKFDDKKYPVATIFARGHAVLKKYLQSDVSKGIVILPADASCRKALELLLKFLDAHNQNPGAEFLICRGEVWQWKLELAQHVFSKLAINPKYKYDISRSYNETLGCPCSVHETMNGERGDTSIGCENGWHGKIDILMADVPIFPAQCEQDLSELLSSSSASETSDTSSSNGIEVKRSMFNDNDYSQIVAETITFSFLKNKGKSNEDITLIPSIAINKEGVQCYFYDSISDVLLQSGYSELVASNSKTFKVNAIVFIWLTLNHQLFCTGTLQKMKSSGFQKLIDLAMYKEQVKAPCRISQDRDQMGISDEKWAKDTNSLEEFENACEIPVMTDCITSPGMQKEQNKLLHNCS